MTPLTINLKLTGDRKALERKKQPTPQAQRNRNLAKLRQLKNNTAIAPSNKPLSVVIDAPLPTNPRLNTANTTTTKTVEMGTSTKNLRDDGDLSSTIHSINKNTTSFAIRDKKQSTSPSLLQEMIYDCTATNRDKRQLYQRIQQIFSPANPIHRNQQSPTRSVLPFGTSSNQH